MKPVQSYRNYELDIGRKIGRKWRYVVHVDKTQRKVNGNERFDFDLSIKANSKWRTNTTVAGYDVTEAETEHRRTLNIPRRQKLMGFLKNTLHIIAFLLLVFSFITRHLQIALLVAFLWLIVITLVWACEPGTVPSLTPISHHFFDI